MLQKYVKNETRQRHPQALLALGQAMLAMDELDQALAAFEECILDHPRDAAAYRARLLAAGVRAEKGQFQQAEALLQENLSGEHLTPDSKESARFPVRLGRAAARSGPLRRRRPAAWRNSCIATPTRRRAWPRTT